MATVGLYDIDAYRGDTFELNLSFIGSDGNPLELPTGDGWKAEIRVEPRSPVLIGEFTIDASDAAGGVIVIRLAPEQTKTFRNGYWDLQHKGDVVRTYVKGSFTLSGDVTQ